MFSKWPNLELVYTITHYVNLPLFKLVVSFVNQPRIVGKEPRFCGTRLDERFVYVGVDDYVCLCSA